MTASREKEAIDWYDREDVLGIMERHDFYVGQLIDEVLEKNLQVIGFTIHDTSRWFSQEIAARIKQRQPSIKIIFGGPSCFRSEVRSQFLENENVDGVCIHEGEIAFKNLINSIEVNDSEDSCCPGMLYKRKNSAAVESKTSSAIRDLNAIPFADFSDFDLRFYDEKGLPLATSRGCINRCVFCEESILWGAFRRREASNIYAEICYQLKKHPQVEYFHFNDSLINADMVMLGELVDFINQGNLHFWWGGQATIREEMNREFIKKMKHTGFSFVSYGLESASEKILKLMGKKFSLPLAQEVIRDTHAEGVYTSINIIIGFPQETWEDVIMTEQFLKRNIESIDAVFLHPLVLLPHSQLYRRKKEFNIFTSNGDGIRGWYVKDGHNDFAARLEKLKFIENSLGEKIHYPFSKFP